MIVVLVSLYNYVTFSIALLLNSDITFSFLLFLETFVFSYKLFFKLHAFLNFISAGFTVAIIVLSFRARAGIQKVK